MGGPARQPPPTHPEASSPETHPTRADPPRRVAGGPIFFKMDYFVLGKDFPITTMDFKEKHSVGDVCDVCPLNFRHLERVFQVLFRRHPLPGGCGDQPPPPPPSLM